MKIGIIGAGQVGGALGRGLARAGHQVVYGVRDPQDAKHRALEPAQVATVRGAVEAAEAVLLTTPWGGTEAALQAAGDFGGKPLLDATNPIGPGVALTHGHTDSGGEQVARWAKNAKVVKVFNSTGLENMVDPAYGKARAAMFACGDDEQACATAVKLAKDLGFDAVRIGALRLARVLEPMAMLWINLAVVLGNGRNVAFGLLRRA
ncbi:MAG TPA: NAD(P)-binding domain-containing protein [Myxococcales bacterium]|nr:NAD(P)-binding domain-containing protein [Myxococcales bacterium]